MRHSLSQIVALIGPYFTSPSRMHCNCAAGLARHDFDSTPLVMDTAAARALISSPRTRRQDGPWHRGLAANRAGTRKASCITAESEEQTGRSNDVLRRKVDL